MTTELDDSCFVCCDTFNKSSCVKIDCFNDKCKFEACNSCIRQYLILNSKDPHCMHCKIAWSQKFIENMNLSFHFDYIINELDRISLIQYQDTNNYGGRLSEYIDKFYRIDKVETIKILSKCICCVRHQINKPMIYDKWIELDIDQESGGKNMICYCKCRTYARWICRTCD